MYKQQYTDQIPADTGDQLSSSSTDKEQEKLRLIGKTVTAISVQCAVNLVQCLEVPPEIVLTKQQKNDQVISGCYAHIVRCIFSNLRNI